MKDIIIRAEALCKTYTTNGLKNHVLRDINIEVYGRDFTAIMGSSGSGKSTLLYNISGMDTPTSGTVHFAGKRIDNLNEKDLAKFRRVEVGFVFQQMHLVSNLTVFENITIPGYLLGGKPRKDIEKRAEQILQEIGIKDLKHRLPSQVSGGQQQRAGVARALINEPALIFADEPTGALNSKTSVELLDMLCELNRNGQSILMVTHDLKAAVRADRIIYLHDGKIFGEIVLEKHNSKNVREREDNVLAWLTARGW